MGNLAAIADTTDYNVLWFDHVMLSPEIEDEV